MFKTLAILATSVHAEGDAAAWDYSTNGADWADIEGYEACGNKNQSPIDLKTDGGYTTYEGNEDRVKSEGHYINAKTYSNQYDATVNFNGHTSQVDLAEDTKNTFKSKLAETVF